MTTYMRQHQYSVSYVNNGTHLQLVHVSTNRVLQPRGQHSVEAQQSHLRVKKQPRSLAKSPGRNISTTWDATTHKRAQRLQDSNRQRLHPRLCGWSPILGIANSCQQAFRRHTATFTATNRWPHSRKQCQLSWKKHLQQGRLLRDQPGNHIRNRTIEGSRHAQLQCITSTWNKGNIDRCWTTTHNRRAQGIQKSCG